MHVQNQNSAARTIQHFYNNVWNERIHTCDYLNLYAERIAQDPGDKKAIEHFQHHLNELHKQISDRMVDLHVQRFGHNGDHHQKKGFEKEIIMLHEKVELVFMRNLGVRLHHSGHQPKKASEEELKQKNNQTTELKPQFKPAHQKAVKIENAYYLCKAAEVGLPLSLKALEFVRFIDDSSVYYVPDLTLRERRQGLINDLESHSIPSLKEMQDAIAFMIDHVYPKEYAISIKRTYWLKYVLAILYHENKDKGIKYTNLIFPLVAHLRSDYFTRDTLIIDALEPLRTALSNKELCESDENEKDPNWEKLTFKRMSTDDWDIRWHPVVEYVIKQMKGKKM